MRSATVLALISTALAAAAPSPARAAPLPWLAAGGSESASPAEVSPSPVTLSAVVGETGPGSVTPWAGLLLDRDGVPLDLSTLSAPERRAALDGARMAGDMIGAAVTNATLQVGARAAPAKLVAKAVQNLGELEKVVRPGRLHIDPDLRIELPTGFSERYLEPASAIISLKQVSAALNAAYTVCQATTVPGPADAASAGESRRLGDCARSTLERMATRYGEAVRARPVHPAPGGTSAHGSPAHPHDDTRPQRVSSTITLAP